MKHFFETMFFAPKWYHYAVMVLLFPLSFLYGSFMLFRRLVSTKKHFFIPIISVGNLIVGGSGKTPFVTALGARYEGVYIISRGYGRESEGLVEVSHKGQILCDVKQSGDEPMLMAKSLPLASVIVSEDRTLAIELAMKKGAKLIIMDDGFNRVEIDKFEILLEPECMPNILPFPAGALREFYGTGKFADVIAKENQDFKRIVQCDNVSESMLLVTAIANPSRLDAYLPEGVVGKVYLDDHAYFDEAALKNKMQECKASTLLVTQKDEVKMKDFKLPLSVMKLKLEIDDAIFTSIDHYIKEKKC